MSLMTARLQVYGLLKNTRYLSLSKSKFDNVVVYALHGTNKPDNSKQTHLGTIEDVPGLSNQVVDYGNDPVGSGASKNSDYKNPEYFSYHKLSYYEAEMEMVKYRLPQPDSTKENSKC
ncbi:hypothetical protein RN001_002363 [Aquatica leii]|uniref:NADH dehydrogenase [ubiquinone] flavoprotein 3, mitochondrial n=1 Tax=Aquatica leii TaxID=1421715 RepID=A0AAN7PGX4_9COLE|nr:hypothetical protein RN001_002363 [Aquatica leii]